MNIIIWLLGRRSGYTGIDTKWTVERFTDRGLKMAGLAKWLPFLHPI
ncbi:hypothetical protein [Paenibacillus andongensis]|nr:hypothetical protein [Paenibacillus andongensis]